MRSTADYVKIIQFRDKSMKIAWQILKTKYCLFRYSATLATPLGKRGRKNYAKKREETFIASLKLIISHKNT